VTSFANTACCDQSVVEQHFAPEPDLQYNVVELKSQARKFARRAVAFKSVPKRIKSQSSVQNRSG
jgi:hypothetical protein